MNAPKVGSEDYIQFALATQRAYSAAESAKVHPDRPDPPAHDAFTLLLHRLEPDPDELWAEAAPQVDRAAGLLILDDSTLDKPHARSIELVTRHWSGKHKAVVRGINLVTLLWTDGDRHVPCDYRVYDKADRLTKNDHFADLLRAASARRFTPRAWPSTAGTPASTTSSGCGPAAGTG